jgi:uncharacterized phage protein (predicted DNA packaging)
MAPETLSKVKTFIRISHDKLDDDITDSIEGCLADLRAHGIIHKDDTDPLILNAIKLYCKSLYIDDTVKADDYLSRYVALRDSLKAAKGYGWKGESDE